MNAEGFCGWHAAHWLLYIWVSMDFCPPTLPQFIWPSGLYHLSFHSKWTRRPSSFWRAPVSYLKTWCELFSFILNTLALKLEPSGICNALTKSNIVTKQKLQCRRIFTVIKSYWFHVPAWSVWLIYTHVPCLFFWNLITPHVGKLTYDMLRHRLNIHRWLTLWADS